MRSARLRFSPGAEIHTGCPSGPITGWPSGLLSTVAGVPCRCPQTTPLTTLGDSWMMAGYVRAWNWSAALLMIGKMVLLALGQGNCFSCDFCVAKSSALSIWSRHSAAGHVDLVFACDKLAQPLQRLIVHAGGDVRVINLFDEVLQDFSGLRSAPWPMASCGCSTSPPVPAGYRLRQGLAN